MSNNQFWAAFGGCMIGFTMIVTGIMLSFCGGLALDAMTDSLGDIVDAYDVSEEWDSTGEVNLLTNLFYVICYAMPIIGIGIMYISVTKWMKYDQYEQDLYGDYY